MYMFKSTIKAEIHFANIGNILEGIISAFLQVR